MEPIRFATVKSSLAQEVIAQNEHDRQSSPGDRFRQALAEETPLQIVGAINAYCALLAREAGYRAIYLSGAGVANASFGMPDLGMTSMTDVVCRNPANHFGR